MLISNSCFIHCYLEFCPVQVLIDFLSFKDFPTQWIFNIFLYITESKYIWRACNFWHSDDSIWFNCSDVYLGLEFAIKFFIRSAVSSVNKKSKNPEKERPGLRADMLSRNLFANEPNLTLIFCLFALWEKFIKPRMFYGGYWKIFPIN